MKIYIAGPMTGVPNYNRSEFFRVAHELSKEGHIVLNPAAFPVGLTQAQYMWMCLPMIDVCDKVYPLKGWRESVGACQEYQRAIDLGKIVEEQL